MPARSRAAVSYAGQDAPSSGSEGASDTPVARLTKKGKGRVARSPSPVYSDGGDPTPAAKKRAPLRPATNGRPAIADSDDSSDDGRPPPVARTPLGAVQLNDQHRLSLDSTKGKRRLSGRPTDLRRQSLNNSVNRAASPAVNGRTALTPGTTLGKGPPPKVAALAATAARRQARHSGVGLLGGQLGGDGPAAPISQEVMTNNYEEWMKMATDNKINATNTWNFALIDYFHDMSLLRNTDDSNSINFQKASVTLDGCVKIWTSRVDSVATQTGKLLSGLAEDGAIMQGQEDDDEEQEGGSDVEGAQRARQRKAGRKAETLVDSFDKIAAKKLDLEVSVDPLFKKTAADFDEGGAGGILMNHLGLDSSMRVIFDAGDARLEDAGVEEAEDEDDGMVDVAQLQAAFLPDLDLIEEMVICPSLASFKFSSDPNVLDLGLFRANLGGSVTSRAHEADPLGDSTVATPTGEAGGDFFTSGAGDEQDFEDFGGGGGDGDDFDDAGDGGADFFADEPEALDAQRPPNEREIVMAFAKDGDGQMFDYFDAALAKNWAGPQHWKMHRTIRRVAAEDEAAQKGKRVVKEKVPFSIDFTTPATLSSKELFEPGTKTATMLPKSKRKATEDHTLPDDMHFNSQQLLRLFLKPKAIINMRRRGPRVAPAPGSTGGGDDVDEHYWAEANAAAANGDDSAGMDDESGMPMPFATQFFNDDGDFGPDYDDDLAMGDDVGGLEGIGPGYDGADSTSAPPPDTEAELLAAMQSQAKRVRPEHVNYAKKAKRVDVRKLKENIWRELRLETEPSTPAPADPSTPAPPTPAVNAKTFTTVLSGLRKAYPEDRMEEISTSFCFICLLHLANEQNLRIGNVQATDKLQQLGALREGDVDEDALYVGDLSALRITKEAYREVVPESP